MRKFVKLKEKGRSSKWGKAGDLGEEDPTPSELDDTSADDTQNSFRTPATDDNATDYGLEFTNNNSLRNSTNPMAKKPQVPLAKEPQVPLAKEPQVPLAKEQSLSTSRKGKSTTTTTTMVPEVDKVPPQKPPRIQKAPTARRKQLNPQSREKKFLKEVYRLQVSTNLLIPRLPFSRLVRELIMEHTHGQWGITREALECLQETSELYVTQRLQDAYLLTLHRGRATLTAKDLELINYLRTTR